MPVALDSSRPYRWPSDLLNLVESISRTDRNNESTWVEWKSELDLDAKSGHQHIARQILGFANRTVATAAHHVGGLAYLVVGAEPGAIDGIAPIDQAVLRPRIVRYVGPAVRWRAEYVTVQTKTVLIVIVDPPKHGDPIYPVRQQLGEHPKGRILVRRAGSTDPADDHEIDLLVARVRAREERLAVVVEPISETIEASAPLELEDLVSDERTAVLARPRAQESGIAPLTAVVLAATGMTADSRSQEDYEREVDAYVERYRDALVDRYLWRLWHHAAARLSLSLANLTEHNFKAVHLRVDVEGDVQAWPEDWVDQPENEPALPRRPRPLGTPTPALDYSAMNRLLTPSYPLPTIRGLGTGYSVENTGSVLITFDSLDLRPEARVSLDAVPLIVREPAGTVLNCSWTATARNVPGRLTGSFGITVSDCTLDVSRLTNGKA
jgi:hypothetical protein